MCWSCATARKWLRCGCLSRRIEPKSVTIRQSIESLEKALQSPPFKLFMSM
jgi:hypothetical protein